MLCSRGKRGVPRINSEGQQNDRRDRSSDIRENATGTPGGHGGNLDTKPITEGARVILPVEFTGALLGIWDLHAAMGDGEICVAACEVPGNVEAKVGVAKGLRVPWPVVETAYAFYILVSHEDLSQAVKEASMVAVQVLEKRLGFEWHYAYMLANLAVDLQISQVVDPRKTVRARIPKSLVSWERLTKAFLEVSYVGKEGAVGNEEVKTELKRVLRMRDLIAFATMTMFPIAPMGMYGIVAQLSHGLVPLAYAIGTVAMFFTA
jgi:hypothetical protein